MDSTSTPKPLPLDEALGLLPHTQPGLDRANVAGCDAHAVLRECAAEAERLAALLALVASHSHAGAAERAWGLLLDRLAADAERLATVLASATAAVGRANVGHSSAERPPPPQASAP